MWQAWAAAVTEGVVVGDAGAMDLAQQQLATAVGQLAGVGPGVGQGVHQHPQQRLDRGVVAQRDHPVGGIEARAAQFVCGRAVGAEHQQLQLALDRHGVGVSRLHQQHRAGQQVLRVAAGHGLDPGPALHAQADEAAGLGPAFDPVAGAPAFVRDPHQAHGSAVLDRGGEFVLEGQER